MQHVVFFKIFALWRRWWPLFKFWLTYGPTWPSKNWCSTDCRSSKLRRFNHPQNQNNIFCIIISISFFTAQASTDGLLRLSRPSSEFYDKITIKYPRTDFFHATTFVRIWICFIVLSICLFISISPEKIAGEVRVDGNYGQKTLTRTPYL